MGRTGFVEEVDRRRSLVTLTMEHGDIMASGRRRGSMAFVLNGSEAATIAELILRL